MVGGARHPRDSSCDLAAAPTVSVIATVPLRECSLSAEKKQKMSKNRARTSLLKSSYVFYIIIFLYATVCMCEKKLMFDFKHNPLTPVNQMVHNRLCVCL